MSSSGPGEESNEGQCQGRRFWQAPFASTGLAASLGSGVARERAWIHGFGSGPIDMVDGGGDPCLRPDGTVLNDWFGLDWLFVHAPDGTVLDSVRIPVARRRGYPTMPRARTFLVDASPCDWPPPTRGRGE